MGNSLEGLVWLALALFMVHEFEEIILVKAWSVRHETRIAALFPKVKPFGLHLFDKSGYASAPITETAAIGIGLQFVLIGLLTLLSVLFGHYLVWLGFMVLMPFLSVFLHARVEIRFKGYTPGFATALLTAVPTAWIVVRVYLLTDYAPWAIAVSVAAVNLAFGFFAFRFLHRTATALSARLQRYAGGGGSGG